MHLILAKQLLRSRAVGAALALMLAMGVASLLIGRQFMERHRQMVGQVAEHQKEHMARNAKHTHDDLGLMLYYVRFALINPPSRLAALAIGQQDVNPSVLRVTIRNLEGQTYDTDLYNPNNLLTGHLDLSFVVLYLFPLLIIALGYNLYAEERESGTWPMVVVQAGSPLRFLWHKLMVRAAVAYALLVLLYGLAIAMLALPIDGALLAFMGLGVAYVAFWFGLMAWVVSFRRSSNFNALVLLGLWVAMAILLPAAANSLIANQYPVPEALATMVAQRDGYHQKWDMEKQGTMDKFYAQYPQYAHYKADPDGFSWLWYYAMQQMGDQESEAHSRAMRAKIAQREKASQWAAMAIPTMHAQLQFNQLAKTSLGHHMQYLDSARAFHERLRLHFYPKIFDEKPASKEPWDDFKPEKAQLTPGTNGAKAVLPILILAGLMFALAYFNMAKN